MVITSNWGGREHWLSEAAENENLEKGNQLHLWEQLPGTTLRASPASGREMYSSTQYNGTPSSGRDAYYHHKKEKQQQQQQNTLLVAGGAFIFVALIFAVWYLSGREVIPLSYVNEGQLQCKTANYLCPTICGNLPGHYKDSIYKAACEHGCNEWGKEACHQACTTNDLSTCTTGMKTLKEKALYCSVYATGEPDPSPHRACLIGVNAVSTTDWPCKQGISIIGKILASHSMGQ